MLALLMVLFGGGMPVDVEEITSACKILRRTPKYYRAPAAHRIFISGKSLPPWLRRVNMLTYSPDGRGAQKGKYLCYTLSPWQPEKVLAIRSWIDSSLAMLRGGYLSAKEPAVLILALAFRRMAAIVSDPWRPLNPIHRGQRFRRMTASLRRR